MLPERLELVVGGLAVLLAAALGWIVGNNTPLFATVMSRSSAATVPAGIHARQVGVLGRPVWNFDFQTPWPSQYIDQPITLVFTQRATAHNVRLILASIHAADRLRTGDQEYRSGVMYENIPGLPPFWSKGVKTDPEFHPFVDRGGIPWDYHIRIYGPFMTPKYGLVMLGSTHRDYNDASNSASDTNQHFGLNETAEDWFAQQFRRRGCTVHPNALNFGNKVNLVDEEHSTDLRSDGWATVVEVWGPSCRSGRR